MAEEIKKVISIETKDSYKTVKDLKNEINGLKDALLNLTPGTKEYDAAVKKLTTAQNQLNSVMNAGKGANSTYAGSFQSLRNEIKEARDVMVGAAQGSDEYAAAAKRAAEASNKLRDMQQEIAYGSSGLDNKFAVMNKTLSGIAGGFAAAQGAMALFGVESENLQKTFVKLQAAISMTQGFKALAELPKALNAAKIAFNGVSVAAKGTSVALKGVKTAIAATGIGLLIVALGELIANWDKVTEAIGNAVGGLDHLREVMGGVSNVIKNFVTGPMKALWQALNGNFKQAADTLKNSFDIAANYAEGTARKASEIANKRLREQAAIDAKELDYQIRLNEAKRGSDWKYSEEAKKMYQDLFKAKLAMYDKDSDEYKNILIQMEAYDREFTDHKKKEEERRAKEQEEARKAAYEKAKAIAEKEREMYEDAASAAGEAILTEFGKSRNKLEERIREFEPIISKAFGNPPFKQFGIDLEKTAKETIEGLKDRISSALTEVGLSYEGMMETLEKGPKEAIPIFDDILNEAGIHLTKELGILSSKLEGTSAVVLNLTRATWEEMVDTIDEYDKLAQESIKNNIINEGEWELFIGAVKSIVNKAIEDETKEVFDLAKTYNQTFAQMQNYHQIWAEGYKASLGEIRDENWKFTEEGKKFYKEYYDGLLVYYRNDFNNWMKVVDEKAKYELERRKYLDAQRKKALQEELAEELALIDAQNLELQKKADESYWAVVYGEETWHKVGSFFGFVTEESLKFYDQEIELNNKRLENFTAGINAQIEELNKELELETLSGEERKQIEREVAELKQQLAEETYRVYAENKDKELEKTKKVESMKKSLLSNTADLAGSLSDVMAQYSEKNAKTNRAAAERQFEASKSLGIAETIFSTLATVQNIIKSFSSMGPWGIAAGAVAGAAALASGWARVMQIRNQKFDDGGGSEGSVSVTSAVAVPQLEQTPYQYTSTVTNAEDEAKLNQPIYVKVTDIEDGLQNSKIRNTEVSF